MESDFISDFIRQEPHAPRPITFREVVGFILDGAAYFWFGLSALILFVGCASLVSGDIDRGSAIFYIVFSCLMLILPVFWMYRTYVALKYGRIGIAYVQELWFDSTKAGKVARGKWEVSVDGQVFRASFDIYASWKSQLYEGIEVLVLVHPRKHKVLRPVGL
jgi:hypothetical protein